MLIWVEHETGFMTSGPDWRKKNNKQTKNNQIIISIDYVLQCDRSIYIYRSMQYVRLYSKLKT